MFCNISIAKVINTLLQLCQIDSYLAPMHSHLNFL